MNENIKEIAEMSGIDIDALSKPHPGGFPREDMLILNDFANSIIKECIFQMEKCFAGSIESEKNREIWEESVKTFVAWNTAIKVSRDKIKNHFGVSDEQANS